LAITEFSSFRLKFVVLEIANGVAAISMTLATTPTIAVDGQSGALNIAIVLGQTAH
jgi:phosphopantothenate synthetase